MTTKVISSGEIGSHYSKYFNRFLRIAIRRIQLYNKFHAVLIKQVRTEPVYCSKLQHGIKYFQTSVANRSKSSARKKGLLFSYPKKRHSNSVFLLHKLLQIKFMLSVNEKRSKKFGSMSLLTNRQKSYQSIFLETKIDTVRMDLYRCRIYQDSRLHFRIIWPFKKLQQAFPTFRTIFFNLKQQLPCMWKNRQYSEIFEPGKIWKISAHGSSGKCKMTLFNDFRICRSPDMSTNFIEQSHS